LYCTRRRKLGPVPRKRREENGEKGWGKTVPGTKKKRSFVAYTNLILSVRVIGEDPQTPRIQILLDK
jgi:L-alanine-DL-glutamate epimerase-like enolase superfamily enzyme